LEIDLRTIPLHGKRGEGLVALVDDEDYELVSQYRWHGHVGISGTYARHTWRREGVWGFIMMHRLVLGFPERVDHINHNTLDNRRSNLRDVSRNMNAANQLPQTGRSSRYKGVSWKQENRKWIAGIKVDQRRIHLGYFLDEEEAARAYDAAALAMFGEYAYLNFPASVGPAA
jgi:hypothetical protein